MDLSKKKCIPCTQDIAPLNGEALEKLHEQLDSAWKIVEDHHLEKEYLFPNFLKALDFTNQVGAVAEEEGHHPDIHLTWGKVVIQIYTHKINGLSESDFILAAKCDALL